MGRVLAVMLETCILAKKINIHQPYFIIQKFSSFPGLLTRRLSDKVSAGFGQSQSICINHYNNRKSKVSNLFTSPVSASAQKICHKEIK